MKIVELEFPLEHNGSVVKALALRMPTRQDFEGIMLDGVGEEVVRMLARLGDLPEELIDELDARDLLAALGAVVEMVEPAKAGQFPHPASRDR